MDERLTGMVGRDQRVAVRRRLAQPRADGEHQIGRLDPRDKFRVGAIAKITRPDGGVIGHRILPPEGRGHGDAPAFGKGLHIACGLGCPACATDDGDGCFGCF